MTGSATTSTIATMITACLALAGCGASNAMQPIGYDLAAPPSAPPAKVTKKKRPEVPKDVVARAAAGITAVRLSDNTEVHGADFVRELLRSDAVCAGEHHDNAADHYAEVELFQQLTDLAPELGLELGLGLEMFAARFQPVLERYAGGKIDEAELLEATEYDDRWGFSFAYYRPLLEVARTHHLPIVGLNAPREITERVAHGGVESLEKSEREALPALDLGNEQHRADFERRMKGHPGLDEEKLDNFYAAQVIWDETMAEHAAKWLSLHAPVRRLLIVAGEAHCEHLAIPARIERRGSFVTSSVWLGNEPPSPEVREHFDYALIVGGPKDKTDL